MEFREIIIEIKNNIYLRHETKRSALVKFTIILTIFIIYFALCVYKYGAQNGVIVSILTWSFFVLCTPIADAGFLLDFPIRILTGIRMVYSEISVWAIAITINLFFILFNPSVYSKTILLKIFYLILTHPIPYWLIIILSAIGTFLSIIFGDELLDVIFHHERELWRKHRMKHKLILMLFILIFIFITYFYLIEHLDVEFGSF